MVAVNAGGSFIPLCLYFLVPTNPDGYSKEAFFFDSYVKFNESSKETESYIV